MKQTVLLAHEYLAIFPPTIQENSINRTPKMPEDIMIPIGKKPFRPMI